MSSSLPSIGYRNGNDSAPNGHGVSRPRVLFVCIENSNRSQMAEGFARMHGAGRLVVESAGSRPATRVNPRAVAAMAERGYDMTGHYSQSLVVAGPGPWDYVVTMGCGDACPIFPGKRYEEWVLDDPAGQDVTAIRPIRDEIERRVRTLLDELKVPVTG